MEKFLKLFTDIPLDEIEKLGKLKDAELNDAKKILARAATTIAHGEAAATEAEATAAALFGGGGNMENVPTVEIKMDADMGVLDFLCAAGMFDSKSDARRMIEQGGVQIDGAKVTDWRVTISPKAEFMVQRGKKSHMKVVVK